MDSTMRQCDCHVFRVPERDLAAIKISIAWAPVAENDGPDGGCLFHQIYRCLPMMPVILEPSTCIMDSSSSPSLLADFSRGCFRQNSFRNTLFTKKGSKTGQVA